jgi:predicted O-methyltransferase YrrM
MKTIPMTPALWTYVQDHNPNLHPALAGLREETSRMPGAQMQISPDQGALMWFLARLIGAKRAVEVGCFTGYSAICVALGLGESGQLTTIDIDPETQKIAKKWFIEAGVDRRISMRLGRGVEILPQLEKEFGRDSFDMAFIDADKKSMIEYYELCLRLIRPGGLILADNVLWSGAVADPNDRSDNNEAIRQFNKHVSADTRCDRMLLNVSDGIFALRKK